MMEIPDENKHGFECGVHSRPGWLVLNSEKVTITCWELLIESLCGEFWDIRRIGDKFSGELMGNVEQQFV